MPYLFDHLDVIEKLLSQSPFGLITDVDGTISPTAPTPPQAEVSPICHHYLSRLCKQLPLVAAISGRPAAEVKDMIDIDGMVYIGNHGLERWVGGHAELRKDVRDYSGIVKAAIKELTPLLSSLEGIYIEDKGITTSIHYRLCPDPQLAKRQILTAVENTPRASKLKIIREKMAIVLLPPVKASKGTALLHLIEEYQLHGGIYLGDDVSDIDAFRAIRAASHDSHFQGSAIGIINQETPAGLEAEANFTLNGVSDVERFLQWMSRTLPRVSA